MRPVDLTDSLTDTIELLTQTAIARGAYIEACGDLLPEELCAHITHLCQLSRLASTLAELAADTLAEES